jgi:hypothetical protein
MTVLTYPGLPAQPMSSASIMPCPLVKQSPLLPLLHMPYECDVASD